jgi:hypothetical protein
MKMTSVYFNLFFLFSIICATAQQINRNSSFKFKPRVGSKFSNILSEEPAVIPVDLTQSDSSISVEIGGFIGRSIGYALSAGGDVNGDGLNDMLIGAASGDEAYLVYGSSTVFSWNVFGLADVTSATFHGQSGDGTGLAVSNNGDCNGDGFADIVLGSPYQDPAGGVYLVFGRSSLSSDLYLTAFSPDQGIKITPQSIAEMLGTAVNNDGDVNGDNYADILIASGVTGGPVYLIYGSASLADVDLGQLQGSQGFLLSNSENLLAGSVTMAEDVNNDGYNDILISYPTADSYVGRVYLVFGKRGPSETIDLSEFTNPETHSPSVGLVIQGSTRLGYSMCLSPDLNGDGFPEMILVGGNVPTVYVVWGSDTLSNIPDITQMFQFQGIQLTASSSPFPIALTLSAGKDFNGDGHPDLLIGVLGNNADDADYASLIFGSSTMTDMHYNLGAISESEGFQFLGPSGRSFGRVVVLAADIDGDDHPDLCISASLEAGAVYLVKSNAFYGGESPANSLPSSQPSSQPSRQPSSQPSSRPSKGFLFPSSLKNGLVSYYAFDGDVKDSTGSGNDGTIFGGVSLVADRSGVVNRAYSFDGSSGYISIPGSQFNFQDALTIAFWAKPAGSQTDRATFLDKSHYNINEGFLAAWVVQQFSAELNSVTFQYVDQPVSITTEQRKNIQLISNEWSHVVITKTGTSLSFYLNAVLVDSQTAQEPEIYSNEDLPLLVGAANNAFTNPASDVTDFFSGILDEIGLWDRALSASEVVTLKNVGAAAMIPSSQPSAQPSRQPSSQPTRQPSLQPTSRPTKNFLPASLKSNLVAFYSFEGNVKDSSGNGNYGTIVGGVSSAVDRFGVANSAYNFDGSTGYMYMPGSQFNFQTDLTIAFWVKPAAGQQAWATWVEKTHFGPSGFMDSFTIQQEATVDNAIFFLYAYAADAVATTRKINIQMVTNAWNHVAITKEEVTLKFYLNGVLVDTQTATTSVILSNGNLPLMIGVSNNGHTLAPSNLGNFFKGVMDEVGFWSRPLTKEEILTLMMNESPTSQPSRQPSSQPSLQPSTQPSSRPTVWLNLPVSLKTDLVAYYTFTGNVKDSSGNGNDGTIVGGLSLTTDRFGVANNAYNFDGSTSYMMMPGTQFNFVNSFTIVFWEKPASTQVDWAVLMDKSNWGIQQWGVELNNVFLQYVNTAGVVAISNPTRAQLVANVWNHVAITKDGTTLLFYLNGELQNTQTGSSAVIGTGGNLPLMIGASNPGHTLPPSNVKEFFKGALDEIGFWNRALTKAEILTLMNNDSPTSQPSRQPSSQPSCQPTIQPTKQPSSQPSSRPTGLFLPVSLKTDLVAYYTFTGNAKDNSGNGNDGTLVGELGLTEDRFGVANNAYYFDGVGGYMVMSGDQFNFVDALTVAFWVKPTSTENDWAALIDKTHFHATNGFLASWVIEQWGNELNKVFLQYVHEPNVVAIPSPVHRSQLVANVWNHVAITKEGTKLLFFLNGELENTQTTTDSVIATNGNLPLLVGACNAGRTLPPSNVGSFFRGVLDEIGFWSRALTPAEIILLMANESPTSQPSRQPSSQPSRQPTSKPTKAPVSYAVSISVSAFATATPPANAILEYNGLSADINKDFGGSFVYISAVKATEGLNAASIFTFTNPTHEDSRYTDLSQGVDTEYFRYLIPSTNYNSDLRVDANSVYLFRSVSAVTTFPAGYSATGDINNGRGGDYLYLIYKQVPIPTPQPTSQPSGQPSNQPTNQPSLQPSTQPSGQPSSQPTIQPLNQPSSQPSAQPSTQPSVQPTSQPTIQPSGQPTLQPSTQPSAQPTTQPSTQPSAQPSSQPTIQPTCQPSVQPTSKPSSQPSVQPSSQPTGQPTSQPSSQPTGQPTIQPSTQPSGQPTSQPTFQPSVQPSGQPSAQPSDQPSLQPTSQPTVQPSGQPTSQPSMRPSGQPTSQPTIQPSSQPSMQPSAQPSGQPSLQPTSQPTVQPSGQPTSQPSMQPSGQPSSQPTIQPSSQPSMQPSAQPSGQPSLQPTSQPTVQPSGQPTSQPSMQPSGQPSSQPSIQPSVQPSSQPTVQPTSQPSLQPTSQPSAQPSGQPSSYPSAQPTGQPSSFPTSQPSSYPTGQPSGFPTGQPSKQPSSAPSSQPSIQPSCQPSSVPTGQPTQMPTQQKVLLQIPYIVNVRVFPRSEYAILQCTLNQISHFGGTVFCTAFQNDNLTAVLPTVNQILSSGGHSKFSSVQSIVNVTVSNLIPSTTYHSFCAVLLSSRNRSSETEITNTRLSWNTTCCKSIAFSHIPSVLNANSAMYESAGKLSDYAISYFLSASPKSEVIIRPMLFPFGDDLESTAFTFAPAFVKFTKSSVLQGQFVINVLDGTVSGEYSLQLNITGSSGLEFTAMNSPTITFSNIPLTPKLSQAIIGDSGVNMFIRFDSSTDMNGRNIGDSFDCNEIFGFNGAPVTSCTWLNTTTIQAAFPANGNRLPIPSEKLLLLSRTIKAACSTYFSGDCRHFNYSSNHSISIVAPYHPIQPVIILNVPKVVGSCERNFTIDTTATTGLGGRAANAFQWTVFRVEEVSSVIAANGSRFFKISNALNSYENPISTFTLQKDDFDSGFFAVSLKITNWMGNSASSTSIINFVEGALVPQLNLVGTFPLVIYAFQLLKIRSNIVLPSCLPTSYSVKYRWALYREPGDQTLNISSQSTNPSLFSLVPYALRAKEIYAIALTVSILSKNHTLSITTIRELIMVKSGIVHSIVKGGNFRQIPFYYNVKLDGSTSYDEDSNNANLVYRWSCLISSFVGFGNNCTNIFSASLQDRKSILVYGNRLEANLTYAITLRVLSSDLQRYSITSVQLQQSDEFSGFTEIVSEKVHFTSNSNFTLDGLVRANSSLKIGWDAFIDGQNYTFGAFSPLSLVVKESYVKGTFIYALVVAANAFPPGSQVTFRLSATTTVIEEDNRRSLADSKAFSSFSTIEMKTNGPPVNGRVSVHPREGFGLETDFTIQTTDWEDDPSDYPLAYSFYFTAQPDNPPLTIVDQSPLASVTTNFPPGLTSFGRRIMIQAVVTDVHSGESVLTTNITVYYDPNVDVTNYLNSHLQLAFAAHDSNAVFSTVNNVAMTVGLVNCSLISGGFCADLNRQNCYSTPQSCGSCLPGFVGIVGSSNALCFPRDSNTTVQRGPGSACVNNSDCLYGACSPIAVCTVPTMSCPSSSWNETCSGHGVCQYLDIAGQPSPEPCLITNVYCKATCYCDSGYGGSDCSLSPDKRLKRDINRGTLCGAITAVTEFSDISSSLVGSMINSLSVTYVPQEVVSESSLAKCTDALTTISALAQDGYLVGIDDVGQTALINTVSDYVTPSQIGKSAYLDSVMSQVTSGLFHTLKNGEIPKSFNSENIQISLQKAFVATMKDVALSPPVTADTIEYGAEVPSFQIVGNSFEECVTNNGFSHFSVMQWGSNPFPNSSSIHSPMLRFSGTFPNDDEVTTESSTDSAYYVTLPFTATQSLDLNLSISAINAHTVHNVTFPNCTIFEGGRYVSCGNCEIATYTNNNVTFYCRNIQNLCQPPKSELSRRRLVGDDDYFSDDSVDLGSGMTASQYGALLEAVGESFVSTLSTNPFNVDIEEAKVVVSLVGSLIVVFLIGSIFFSAWDGFDRLQFIYGETWPPSSLVIFQPSTLKGKMKKKVKQKMTRRNMSATLRSLSVSKALTQHADSNDKPDEEMAIAKESVDIKSFCSDIVRFFDLAVPTIFHSDPKKGWWKVFKAILIRHDYTSLFFHPSSEKNRFMRWMDLYNAILNGLFISTLFYGTFYSNSGQCERYLIENDCTNLLNKITGETQCSWDKDTQICSLNEPPANFSFTIILALTCTLIGVPLQLSITFLLDEYCNKRPRLEDIGLSTEYWVGIGVKTTPTEINYEKGDRPLEEPSNKIDTSGSFGSGELPVKLKFRKNHRNGAAVSPNSMVPIHRSYDNLLTVEEEMERIFWLAHRYYLALQTVENETFIANLNTTQSLVWRQINDSKTQEIIRNIGLQPDGKFSRLPFYEYLLFSSRRNKAVRKLEKVRATSEELMDQLEELATIDQSSLQDVLLLYSFILEQFPTFKRWILKDQLLCFEGFFPSVIGFYPWVFAWALVLAVYLFYCYWIFTWGIANGNLLLKQWGLNFAIGAIQDILFVQIVKILILYFIALFSIKPQLVEIKQILINIAIRMVQDEHGGKNTKNALPKQRTAPSDIISLRKFFQFSLIDSSAKVSTSSVPVSSSSCAEIPPSIFEQNFTVVQFMSPTCRVAWQNAYNDLFLSKILRQLDDYDAALLRKQFFALNKNTILNYLIIFVPLVMIFFGAVMAEMLLDTVLPTAASGIIVADYYLSTLSPTYVIVLWICGVFLLLFYYRVWRSAYKFTIRQQHKAKIPQSVKRFTNMLLERRQTLLHRLTALSGGTDHPRKKNRNILYPLRKAVQSIFSKKTVNKLQLFLGKLNLISYYYQNKLKKQREMENMWKNMNLPLIFQGKKIVFDRKGVNSLPKIYGHVLSIDYSTPTLDLEHSSDNSNHNRSNPEIVLSRSFSRSYDSHNGFSMSSSSSAQHSPFSQSRSEPQFQSRTYSTASNNYNHYPELSFSLDGAVAQKTFGGLPNRRDEFENLFELKDYLQSTTGGEGDTKYRSLSPRAARKSQSMIFEYSDFEKGPTKPKFISLDSIPSPIHALKPGSQKNKEKEKKDRKKKENDENKQEGDDNENDSNELEEDETENYFVNDDRTALQNFLSSTLLKVPKNSDEINPFIVKLIQKNKEWEKGLDDETLQNENDNVNDNTPTVLLSPFSPLPFPNLNSQNKARTRRTPGNQVIPLTQRLLSKHYTFCTIDGFLFNFLFLLLEMEYREKKVEISKEMMEEMVSMIGIQYQYHWIVSKESLTEIFTKPPRSLQKNGEQKEGSPKDNNNNNNSSIWDHYHPNGMTLNREQFQELMNDFLEWIRQEQFCSSSNSSAEERNSNTLKTDYFSFHFFKDWFEQEMPNVVKMMTIRLLNDQQKNRQ